MKIERVGQRKRLSRVTLASSDMVAMLTRSEADGAQPGLRLSVFKDGAQVAENPEWFTAVLTIGEAGDLYRLLKAL